MSFYQVLALPVEKRPLTDKAVFVDNRLYNELSNAEERKLVLQLEFSRFEYSFQVIVVSVAD